MNVVNERSELPERSAVNDGHGFQDGRQNHGATATSSTSREVEANEQRQSGRRRTRIGRALLKPFKLVGSGLKKAVRCCFQCSTSERGGVVPVVEIVEDRNQGVPRNAHDEPRLALVEDVIEKNEGPENGEHHGMDAGTLECRLSADTGLDVQPSSGSCSGDEEKGDRETLKEQDGGGSVGGGLTSPVVVKKAFATVISAAEDDGQPVLRSTSPSDVAASLGGQSGENGDATANVPEAEVKKSNEDSSDYELNKSDDFRGVLIEEEVVMTSENDDLNTEEDSEAQSHADYGRTFQDDSYLQFFVNEQNESSGGSENGSVGSPSASASGEDEMSDHNTQNGSEKSVTETDEESPSVPSSESDSLDSDQIRESVENRDGGEATHSSDGDEESQADDIRLMNRENIVSRASSNSTSRDGSPLEPTIETGRNQGESNGNESQQGNSVFGFVLSKLRSVLTSFRRENSEAEEQNFNDAQAEHDSDNEIETSSNSSENEGEVAAGNNSGSCSQFSSSAVDSFSKSDANSGSAFESAGSGEGVEGGDSKNRVQEAAVSHKSSQDDQDDQDDAESVPISGSSGTQSLEDSDHSSQVMSSSIAESFEDSDQSSQAVPSSSARSIESSSHSSGSASLSSAESPADSDYSSQVVTSSSADMQTDSDEIEFGEESE